MISQDNSLNLSAVNDSFSTIASVPSSPAHSVQGKFSKVFYPTRPLTEKTIFFYIRDDLILHNGFLTLVE